MTVSKRLRYEILRRDNHTCRYCGRSAPEVKMTVDHVTAVSLGGGDDPMNLVAACADCNSGKSATPPTADLVADVAQSALRWSAALERAAEIAAAQAATDQEARDDLIESIECVWTSVWLEDPDAADTSTKYRHPGRSYAPQPFDWAGSIQRMINAGLTLDDLRHAIHIAQHKSDVDWAEVWRYFCGVAWSMLRERQDIARALLDAGEV